MAISPTSLFLFRPPSRTKIILVFLRPGFTKFFEKRVAYAKGLRILKSPGSFSDPYFLFS